VSTQISTEAVSNEPNVSLQSSPFLHLSALDSLRGLAALYVFLGHTIHQVAVDETQIPKIIRVIFRSLDFGAYAVVLFIVLSGFCLMLPIIRNNGVIKGSIKNFFFRRAKRILPPYYATLLISIGLALTILNKPVGNLWDGSIPITLQGTFTHIFLIHDIFRSDIFQSNPSLWSIAVEWRIYFLFPLIVLSWKKWGGWKTSLGALGVSYTIFAILSQFSFFNSEPPGPSLHYVALFCAGMLAAEISFSETEWNRQLRKNIPWSLVAAVFFILAVPASGIRYMRGISWILADLSAGVTSMALLVSLMSFPKHPLNDVLKWKPLVKIGSFSYSIYLLHVPLIQVFYQYISHPLNLPPVVELAFVLLIGMPLVTAISYLFFLLAEKPFLSQRAKQIM
jgi:peptidoglycan/LPS O-acetylase OafA/YrhL